VKVAVPKFPKCFWSIVSNKPRPTTANITKTKVLGSLIEEYLNLDFENFMPLVEYPNLFN